jgi:hypothetical protein
VRWARWRRGAVVVGIVGLLTAGGVWFVYRPWALNWGATLAEIARGMPGDDVISDPNFCATRAVTVEATPAEIWPWLVQMGYRRAGFYSYDRLDNDGIPSAVDLLPEHQDLEVGDSLPLTAHDYVAVTVMAPDSSMLWEYAGDEPTTVFTWAWRLNPVDGRRTRLVTRLRYRASGLRARVILDLFEIVMMRKCLLGIQERAESRASSRAEVEW